MYVCMFWVFGLFGCFGIWDELMTENSSECEILERESVTWGFWIGI